MQEITRTISEAAKQLGVETHVLRYWEEELDISIPRNEMGHRVYGIKEMKLFSNIIELKSQGFQLRAIKLLLHDLKKGEELDLHKLIAMREEINRRVEFLNEEGIEVEDSLPELIRKTLIQKQLRSSDRNSLRCYAKSDKGNVVGSNYTKSEKNGHLQISDDGKVTRLPVQSDIQNVETDTKKENGIPSEKLKQFQYVMVQIMNQALSEQNKQLEQNMKQMIVQQFSQEHISAFVSQMTKQINAGVIPTVSNQVAKKIEDSLGNQLDDRVTDKIIKEMNYLARVREEQQEEHFQKIDEQLRLHQKKKISPFRKKKQSKRELKQVAAAKERNINK